MLTSSLLNEKASFFLRIASINEPQSLGIRLMMKFLK